MDYGSVRVGIALSDESRMIAFGRGVFENKNSLFDDLLKLMLSENVTGVVVGYPLNMKGERTRQTENVERFESDFKDFLSKSNVEIEIRRWDERLTSKMAEDSLLRSGMKKKKRQDKSNLDIISATFILQSYLDSI